MIPKKIIVLAIAAFVFSLGPAWASNGKNIKHYLNKYKLVTVTLKQKERLSRYNYLISYFSSFAYVKPRHKINPDFIRALILAESGAYPTAISKKDARGLTQIMYETGRKAAMELAEKPINFRYVSKSELRNLRPNDLFKPTINILLACYLVAKYNHQYSGRLDLVVSAWNAGENSIMENMAPSYSETLNLIGKVNGIFLYFLRQKQYQTKYAYRS